MASNRHTPRLVRLAVITTITAFTVTVLPGTGQAAPAKPAVSTPTTAKDAASKVAQLGHQLEVLSENINGQKIQVDKLKATNTKAQTASKTADAAYAKLTGEVATIVKQTYISAPFGQFTTLMTSGSPQDFLDQLSTLERMSSDRAKIIGQVVRTKQQADKAKAAARTAYSAAISAYTKMTAQKKSLDGQISQYTALYDKLNAKEKAALVGPPARRGGGRPTVPTGLPPAPNPNAQQAVNAALSKLGDPYIWGAAGPDQFDCSGLTSWAWAQAGVSIPHQSGQQYGYGTHIAANLATLKPGDLIFYYSPISHVAMYIGNGQQVHAPTSGDVVKIASVDWGNLVGATRL